MDTAEHLGDGLFKALPKELLILRQSSTNFSDSSLTCDDVGNVLREAGLRLLVSGCGASSFAELDVRDTTSDLLAGDVVDAGEEGSGRAEVDHRVDEDGS